MARRLAPRDEIETSIKEAFATVSKAELSNARLSADEVVRALYKDSFERKQIIARLVNFLVTSVAIEEDDAFEHPLLRYRAVLPDMQNQLLRNLKEIAFKLVIDSAQVQQLEQRGQRLVTGLFEVMKDDPERLIPRASWADRDHEASMMRVVCDYVAGMTDAYAEKVYRRLFVPGFGSSGDEL